MEIVPNPKTPAAKPTAEQTKFWFARDVGNVELLRATYITHTFSRHAHEGFAIGIIEQGAEAFYYRGAMHVAPAGSIVLINPGEVHTGHAAGQMGWTYRMLYPEAALLQQAASEAAGRARDIPYFQNPVIEDPYLTGLIRNLHVTLEQSTSPLDRQSHFLATLIQLVLRHADDRPVLLPAADEHRAVKRARAYLEAHYVDNVSLEQLARLADLSPFHLTRIFSSTVGLPPHAYLTQVRIRHAKRLLSRGWPIAQVALETGFADQSHLTRHFKRIIGITPGQYILNSKNVQDKLAWEY
jgi:AraC-like DNA-binding protein